MVDRAWHYKTKEYAEHQPNLQLWVALLKAFGVRSLANADAKRASIDCTVDQHLSGHKDS